MQNKDKEIPTGNSAKVLIPVDFSPKCDLAIKVGFELARRLGHEIELIHASVIANPTLIPQFPADNSGFDTEEAEIEEMELENAVEKIDSSSMRRLEDGIKKMQSSGDLPEVPFKTIIAPGMPEEVIKEYCDLHNPEVIVMSTRGKDKRREELIGSVTAEVIDHCIAPVLTVPEDYTFSGFKEIVRIVAFCYFDEGDFTAISNLMKMFSDPEVTIYLFPATDKVKGEACSRQLAELQTRLKGAFPKSEFKVSEVSNSKDLRESAEALFIKEKIQMILAPNKRRNALSRIFNPGLPHKILYEIDFPMFAIPVRPR